MRGNAVREVKSKLFAFPAQALPWSGSTGIISVWPLSLKKTYFIQFQGQTPRELWS